MLLLHETNIILTRTCCFSVALSSLARAKRFSVCVSASLFWLLPVIHHRVKLQQIFIPVLWEQQQQKAQADSGHSNDAHTVELDITHVAVYYWKKDEKEQDVNVR